MVFLLIYFLSGKLLLAIHSTIVYYKTILYGVAVAVYTANADTFSG